MSFTKEQILNSIADMSVMDVIELIAMMEEKFGISCSSRDTIIPIVPSEDIEEKIEFNVILSSIGNNKISVIKTVRGAIGLGLKESKDLVESAPITLKEGMNKDDAEALKKALEEVGASVEIK